MWPSLRASLQLKMLFIVSMTLLSLFVALYIPLRQLLLGSFVSLEEQMQRTNVERAANALADTLLALDTLNASYAIWDDTYAFFERPNAKFIADNWYDSYLVDAQLSLVVLADTTGRVVFSKAFDLGQQRVAELPARFRRLGPADPLLRGLASVRGATGVILLPGGPMLVSSQPVLTSQEQGPPRGVLIMGRYLDAHEIARLSERTNIKLTVHRLDQAPDAGLLAIRAQLREGSAPLVRAASQTTVEGFAHLPDLDGGPGLLLRAENPRSVYAQGEVSVRSFMAVLLAMGSGFGVVMLALIDRVVLRRLATLSRRLRQIGAERDLGARVTVVGNDELADLAHSVNGMLVALERAQVEHQQHLAAGEEMRLREENLRARRELVSLVSHELRTPLTPILGYTELLLLDAATLSEEQIFALESIKRSTGHLRRLVDDLLEIGRLEANKLSLSIAPASLAAAAAEAIDGFQGELEHKQLTLSVALDPELPPIEADYQRLVQIFNNLLSNAIKYTYPRGQIVVWAAPAGPDQVEVQISDSGIGLTPEQQARLFTPFYRADHALHSQERGTGLGLTMVRALVELHGGQIRVESRPGAGSTFAFTLPVRHPRPPAEAAGAALAAAERGAAGA